MLNGADIRFAASFKNPDREIEMKVYTGTDFALAASWKSGKLEYKHDAVGLLNPKANVSVHYRAKNLSNLMDADTWKVDIIDEVDNGRSVPLYSGKGRLKAFSLNATPGVRYNFGDESVRTSLNVKLELPRSLRIFGWTPSIGIEVRKDVIY